MGLLLYLKKKILGDDYYMSSNATIDEKEIVSEVLKDFNERREKRRPFEQSWLLNINFLIDIKRLIAYNDIIIK